MPINQGENREVSLEEEKGTGTFIIDTGTVAG